MPQKMQDITQKPEQPQNQENLMPPEKIEIPAKIEVERKFEAEKAPAWPKEGKIEEEKREAVIAPPAPQPVTPITAKSPTQERIEQILAEDLEEIYFQLPPNKQAEFKEVGEETASRIEMLLGHVKIKVKKILQLIIAWLKIIPGLNHFFLEQEAKIKTDEILKLKPEKINPPQNQNKI